MLVPGRMEKFEFENLAETLKPEQRWEKKIAQATVTIERIQRTNDLWEVQMKLSYDQAHDAFDSHLAGWILQYQPQLIDADGKLKTTLATTRHSATTKNTASRTTTTFRQSRAPSSNTRAPSCCSASSWSTS